VGPEKPADMTEQTVSRTLVKSPPELWAEVSDPGSLARHLGEFGEIRITRLEEESTVAWEGERASGTVELAPSGWGTRVTLTACTEDEVEVEPEPVAVEPEPVAVEPEPVAVEPEPEPEPEPIAQRPRAKLLARLFRRRRAELADEPVVDGSLADEPVADEPDAEPQVAAEPVAEAADEPAEEVVEEPAVEPDPPTPDALLTLTSALDSLGSAHHRPFSRG
jgi:hypothetical protein